MQFVIVVFLLDGSYCASPAVLIAKYCVLSDHIEDKLIIAIVTVRIAMRHTLCNLYVIFQ